VTALTVHPQRNNVDFRVVARSFLLGEGLPLANVLPAAEIERVFRRQDAIFGSRFGRGQLPVHPVQEGQIPPICRCPSQLGPFGSAQMLDRFRDLVLCPGTLV
jgi:hypothetical protein